ncbi:hypothetical protein ACVXHA_07225 [Escherichia coli]
MQQFAIAGAASVQPFQPDFIGTAFTKNILTRTDLNDRSEKLVEKLWDILKQQGRP